MRKAWVLSLLLLLAVCAVAQAASKVGTFGAANSSGTAPMEVDSARAITVASDATFTNAGTTSLTGATSVGALTATSAEVDGILTTDGTIYTAKIVSDGAIYVGMASVDPCPGLANQGFIFFNPSGMPCFCNKLGVDLSIYDGTTACF